jgi:tRNA/rRNA methyltransferase
LADCRVILVEPSFEESIGFVARAMKNFGLSNLHLVNPLAALGPSGRARSGHAQEVLDSIVEHHSLKEALEQLDLSIGTTAQKSYASSNLVRKPITPRELGLVLRNQAGTVGLVFGREGTGLTNAELSQCDVTLTIPAASDYPTLNLSHAAAIVFYELHCSAGESLVDELASEEVKKTILKFLSESAALSGTEEYERSIFARAFRNVLGRSAIRRREASLLVQVFRTISEALTLAKNQADSVTPTAVSESAVEGTRWTTETPGLAQRRNS